MDLIMGHRAAAAALIAACLVRWATADVAFQLQVFQRIHSIDIAEIEPDGSDPEHRPDGYVDYGIRQRLRSKCGRQPRIDDVRPHDPAELKHGRISNERSGATTL